MSSFAIYLVGLLILVVGLAYGAHLAGIATQWIVVGAVVACGAGLLTAATRTRQKDASPEE